MKFENIDLEKAILNAKKTLKNDKNISSSTKTVIQLLITLVTVLVNKLTLNSSNSSISPSNDKNRDKEKEREKRRKKNNTKKKPGGQKEHVGKTLIQTKNPDKINYIKIDKKKLPKGKWKKVGIKKRQEIVVRVVTETIEYQAEILKNETTGEQIIADFPKGINSAIQYGVSVKKLAVCLSQYHLLPYCRLQEIFSDLFNLSLSTGTIKNFIKKASDLIKCDFEPKLKEKLINSNILHADETGINIGGKLNYVHVNSNEYYTFLYPHRKRGQDAMIEMEVLPKYAGFLVHDHWKSYYRFKKIKHVLCNAHHLRELERAWEQDKQEWAKNLINLLKKIHKAVKNANGKLSSDDIKHWSEKYDFILEKGKKECPILKKVKKPKRGRTRKSKARNLLERLINFKDDTLMFMTEKEVPFTNNLGERDIRMLKVEQKISGCFRSFQGAKDFCRIRSFVSSAKKNNISVSYALKCLFEGKDVSDKILG